MEAPGFRRRRNHVSSIRHRLIALVFVVVGCQLAGTAAVPVVFCSIAAAESTTTVAVECSLCARGDKCPMHAAGHKPAKPASRPGEARCTGCGDNAHLAVTALMGFAGPIVAHYSSVAPESASELLLSLLERPLAIDPPAVSRPPRS